MAVDAEGNSYVTGTSQGVDARITTVKYSPAGEELWAVQLETVSATATDIALDNAGGVYITGSSGGTAGVSFTTVRYDAATGQEIWMRLYSGSGGGPSFARAIAVDNAGGVYVTGESTGSSPVFTSYTTVRYEAATGHETWVRQYSAGSAPSFATAIAADNAGSVYVTGSAFSNRLGFSDYATVRYDAGSGAETWARLYNGPGNENDFATDIAVGYAGGVYVTGYSGTNFSSDYATLRYEAATGEETWAKRYNSADGSFERASAIAVDNAGGVYVTGYSSTDNTLLGSDYATVRYDAATGAQDWAAHYAESADNVDVAVDLATDNSGNVIVTGYNYNPETFYDFLTIKYSQQGTECPDMADDAIAGNSTVSVGTTGSEYYFSGPAPLFATWTITDSEGNSYTNFTGQGSPTISVNWPSEPDFFKVSLTYGTLEGCTLSTSPLYVHAFDPDAGFVTGGGWIESPANPDYEFMQESRRAHLSLMARYSKGNGNQNQVQGSTMLLLQAGSFTFRSTSYEAGSLVITHDRAYYSGRGTVTYRQGPGRPVNDQRQFGFLVAATDGDIGANAGPDRFRLKIWEISADGSRGAVVYDSQAGCPSASMDDNAEACTALGGGNITIHKPRHVSRKQALATVVSPDGHELKVYPTSASDRATVSFSLERAGEYALELYDMKGALVKRIAAGAAEAGKRYEQDISVESLDTGLYLARLTTREKIHTVKLVVQH